MTQPPVQAFMAARLPPPPGIIEAKKPIGRRNMDNRPSWMTVTGNEKCVSFEPDDTTHQDNQRKEGRLWVFSANILVLLTLKVYHPPTARVIKLTESIGGRFTMYALAKDSHPLQPAPSHLSRLHPCT